MPATPGTSRSREQDAQAAEPGKRAGETPEPRGAPADAATWWRHGVIYQVYPRSFRDASGDGTGDLPGVTEKLDYLATTLGVDAVWLSPFYTSPMADFGYDVADYLDVDPLFGTLADFDTLLAEAHARGLRVIVDYVPNHTSDQHPWFQESRSSRENRRRDWYVWRDPKPDGSPPNNWLGAFGGSSWAFDETTGQYYLHSFLPEQPDLNWRNPDVQTAMLDVLHFWLDRGVDGFRMDALNCTFKDPALRDNPEDPSAASRLHKAMGEFGSQLHVHDRGHPDIHGAIRAMRQVLDAASTPEQPRIAIGEMHIFDYDVLARFHGEHLDELHLPFNFGLLKVPWSAEAVGDLVDRYEASLPEGAWPNFVLGNHDEPRLATRVGPEHARLAMLLLLTLRGMPTLYYGDELGLEDVPIPPEREQDPWGKRVPGLGLGRDPARTPMPWDGSPGAGFCPPGVETWLPLNPDAATRNVAAQLADPASMLAFTRQLLALRCASPSLLGGGYQRVTGPDVPHDCLVYRRQAGADRLVVALNFAAKARRVPLPGDGAAVLRLSTHLDRAGPLPPGSALDLRPGEGCVLAPPTR